MMEDKEHTKYADGKQYLGPKSQAEIQAEELAAIKIELTVLPSSGAHGEKIVDLHMEGMTQSNSNLTVQSDTTRNPRSRDNLFQAIDQDLHQLKQTSEEDKDYKNEVETNCQPKDIQSNNQTRLNADVIEVVHNEKKMEELTSSPSQHPSPEEKSCDYG